MNSTSASVGEPMIPAHAQSKKHNYVYTPLRDTTVDSQDQFNFFGVIIDAAYPYKTQQGKYICTVKIVDHTLHHRDQQPGMFATAIIYAKRFEDLPIVKNLGDVIRIHRANMKQYQDQKQFHVNVYYNSSWCLFSLKNDEHDFADDMGMDNDEEKGQNEDQEMDDEEKQREREERRRYRPYKFSGKSYTFDINHEKSVLDDLRDWTMKYFQKEYVITKEMYRLLGDLKASNQVTENQEFDLLVKVLKVTDKDENTLELRIKDTSQKIWFMSIPKMKFQNIRQGEIVRIRCVELNLTTKRDVIQVKNYTNILKIHPQSRIFQEFTKTIEDETDTDKLLLDCIEDEDVLLSPVIYTDIIAQTQHGKQQTFKLTDLFLHYEQIPQEIRDKNSFHVRFYCLRVDPQDPKEIVQAMCPKCKETYSCKDLDKEGRGKCKPCKTETKLVYKMQMLVKDSSSQLNKNFYRILLFSYEDEKGDNFFQGVSKPCNLYHNEESLHIIEKHIRNIQRFNVWIDAVIERQSTYFLIKDTQIKNL